MEKIKKCKFCRIEINAENAFIYETRNGKSLIRNSCKSCYMKSRKQRSGTKKVTSKKCPSCKIIKNSAEYGKDGSRTDGIGHKCLACARTRNYKARIYQLHKITWDQYIEMQNSQGSRCKVCGKKKKLVVDHDHNTSMVRGLLCDKCNMAIGLLEDNPKIINKAEKYVKGE